MEDGNGKGKPGKGLRPVKSINGVKWSGQFNPCTSKQPSLFKGDLGPKNVHSDVKDFLAKKKEKP